MRKLRDLFLSDTAFMSPELINTLAVWLEIVVTVIGAMVFALWAGTIIWTFNDMRARSWDWAAILLAALLVALVPFVGLVVYLLVRPKESLADTYDRALEEEALLRDMDTAWKCSQCSMQVKEEWIYCPQCRTTLQYSCRACGHNIRTDWQHCAFCGVTLNMASPPDSPVAGAPEAVSRSTGPGGQDTAATSAWPERRGTGSSAPTAPTPVP